MPLYVATAFRGADRLPAPVYDRREAPTLAEARAAAAALYEDRPVGIYAVRHGRWEHLENCEPARSVARGISRGRMRKRVCPSM